MGNMATFIYYLKPTGNSPGWKSLMMKKFNRLNLSTVPGSVY